MCRAVWKLQAERYFTRMQEMGSSPDAVTAVTLLNAYSHSGEADKAAGRIPTCVPKYIGGDMR